MKHLKPVTKAEVTASSVLTLVISLLSALAPIIEWAVSSNKNTDV